MAAYENTSSPAPVAAPLLVFRRILRPGGAPAAGEPGAKNKAVTYSILMDNTNAANLAAKVTAAMKQGWEPAGGAASAEQVGQKQEYYYQP